MTDFFCSLANTRLVHSCSQFRFILVTVERIPCGRLEGKGEEGLEPLPPVSGLAAGVGERDDLDAPGGTFPVDHDIRKFSEEESAGGVCTDCPAPRCLNDGSESLIYFFIEF